MTFVVYKFHTAGAGFCRKNILYSLISLFIFYQLKKKSFTCSVTIFRSIGVSNFGVQHLEGMKKAGVPTPAVNQIELHPWMKRYELVSYCRDNGIAVMGYSPLVKAERLKDPTVVSVAKK